jgi:RHS repeat-associated protein
MNPPFFSPFRWTQRTLGARIFQFFLIAFFSAWLIVPQQVWAGCACSDVAVGRGDGSGRVTVEKYYGALTLEQVDVDLPGYAGVKLVRRYDALHNAFGMFGYGWSCGEFSYLITTTGDIKANVGGNGETFRVADNYANIDRRLQLSFSGENEVVIENREHDKWYFDQTTRGCTKFVDKNGNATLYDMTITNLYVGQVNGTNAYQDAFLVNRITFPDGREMSFEYTSNLCTRAISPDGRTNDYSYTDRLLTGVSRDDGMALEYGYHTASQNGITKGWLTSIAYANGAEVNIAYNGEFDTTNRLRVVEVTGPLGYDYSYGYTTATDTNSSCGCRTTTFVTDSLGRDTVYTYEQGGAIKRTTNAMGYVSTTFSTNGIAKSFTDNRGNTTWYVYDSGNTDVVAQANLLAFTNTLGKVWSYGYDSNNRRIRTVSPLGQTNQFKYDEKGNLVAITNGLGNQTASMSYSTNGLRASSTDARGNSTTLFYNNEGLVTNTVDALTNCWIETYDVSGNMVCSIDPLGDTTRIGYNSHNKPSAITNALGSAALIAYDEMANLTNVTDALGHSLSVTYDQFQRPTKIRDALGNETTFCYDPESNLTVLSNALGHAYSYTFDAVNRTKTFLYPDASTESYVYDANDNLTGLTNRSGQVITAAYDEGNRLATKTWEGSTNVVFSSGYDDANRLLTVVRTKSGVVESAITNTWNAADRITQQCQGAFAVGYGYDAAGNVTNVSYPSGLNLAYSYDALNRISSIRDSTNATALATYEFDAAGRPTKRSLENGTETVYAWDAANRVTNMILRVTALPTNMLWSAAYGYDVVGNRTWVKNKNGRGDVYQYDATYQVTGVKYDVDDPTVGYSSATNPSRTVTYNWDALGNRSSVVDNGNSTSYSVSTLNQYSSVGGTNLTYDTRGNLTGDGVWTFSYDHENHLILASKNGTTASYTYDGLGRRISKTVNGTTTRYVYSGSNLIEERGGSGMVLATYVYEGGVDRPVKVAKSGNVYCFQRDVLGNVIALVNASGQIAEQYTFDVFGQPTIKDGSGNVLSSALTPFLFTGREWDSEIGLYHYRARAYSPSLGRFLQADPIDFEGDDPNMYR